MAVTKIRKISRWTLYVVTFINLALLALFFFGGVGDPYGTEAFKNPTYTGELLIWCYILLVICVIGMLMFGITQFAGKFKTSPKAALVTLGIFVGLAGLHIVAYILGDGTLLTVHMNEESQKFNIEFWLKVTDMWLYAMYTMAVLALLAMAWGSIRKIISK